MKKKPLFEVLGEVQVDGRRRLSLARTVPEIAEGDRYRVEINDDGVLRLVPVISVERGANA